MNKQTDTLHDSSLDFSKALAKVLEVAENEGYIKGWDEAYDLSRCVFEDRFEDLLSYALRKLQKQNPEVKSKEVLLSFPIRKLIPIIETKLNLTLNLDLSEDDDDED